ncbi:CopG family transcriptional regulator [Streptomyces sp. NPDC086080]|uniref:CopG family transcriptional regulator n=1 Tax=Streptomyces sp. NPDC086080 TaxID=3365748 RepID=UPI0037D8722A
MTVRHIDIDVDDSDLQLIKEAAARRGVSEAEMIREGIHQIAMAYGVRAGLFVADEENEETFTPGVSDIGARGD